MDLRLFIWTPQTPKLEEDVDKAFGARQDERMRIADQLDKVESNKEWMENGLNGMSRVCHLSEVI